MKLTSLPFVPGFASDVANWPASQSEVLAWTGQDSYPVSPTQLLHWQAEDDVYSMTGHLDRELVAYGELWVDRVEDEVELARIIVHPAYRSKGVGRDFVRLLVDHASDFRLSATVIRVSPDNDRAIRCYEATGFERMSAEEHMSFNHHQPCEYVWLRFH